jgi:hypothetical protein
VWCLAVTVHRRVVLDHWICCVAQYFTRRWPL